MARLRVSGKAIDKRKKKWTKPYVAASTAMGAVGYGMTGGALGGVVGAAVGAGTGLIASKMHGSAYARQKARSVAKGKKQTKLRKVGRFLGTGTAPGMAWSYAKTKKTKHT